MKASELRIGNFISVKTIVEDSKVISITPRFFSSLAGGRSFEDQLNNLELSEYYQPIPLTEEWLLKFGFEKDDSEGDIVYFQLKNYGVKVEESRNFYFYKGEGLIQTLKEIQYVHQLQNLYFALTGEELTINQ